MYWDKQFWHVNEMISIKDERVPSAHKKEPTNSILYHDELFTLWARCLAHKRKSAMFTALRRRAFEGASKMAFRGMCLSILCTPSLWGLSTIVYNDITRVVRRYDSIFDDGIDHSTRLFEFQLLVNGSLTGGQSASFVPVGNVTATSGYPTSNWDDVREYHFIVWTDTIKIMSM